MDLNEGVRFVNEKYVKAFQEYGRSPKGVLWGGKYRQYIRFYELLKRFDLTADSTILDVGCGFADLFLFCREHLGVTPDYSGIDYCDEFIKTIAEEPVEKRNLMKGNFLTIENLPQYDFCVTSGIFNTFNYSDYDGDKDGAFLHSVVSKMFALCRIGISFNFVTDKVDFRNKGVTYYSPAEVLDFCYTLSRKVVYDNTCMPFEATVTVFKDDSYNEERVFHSFVQAHALEF